MTPLYPILPWAGVRYRIDHEDIDESADLADELLIGFEDGVACMLIVNGTCSTNGQTSGWHVSGFGIQTTISGLRDC